VIKKPQYRGGQNSTWAVVPWEKIVECRGEMRNAYRISGESQKRKPFGRHTREGMIILKLILKVWDLDTETRFI
jgi:hypothetical protein